jgi:hypothetical protein
MDELQLNNPNLEIINADLRDSTSFSEACKEIDVVLCLSHVDSNANYTWLVKLAKASNVKYFAYHSYGLMSSDLETKQAIKNVAKIASINMG